LKDHYAAAQSDKDRAAICSHVEGVANGFQAMTQASISLAGAIKSGDPFAISASSLDLATSLVGTVSLFGGPIGAAVGAVLGAILSIVSMILKMFQKEEESLLSRIEQMARKLQAETQIEGLLAASGHLMAFTTTAINAYAKLKSAPANVEAAAEEEAEDEGTTSASKKKKDKSWKYNDILLTLNQNTKNEMLKARGWLINPLNQELEQWGEALALLCQAYASFKVGVAYWLPVIGRRELHKLISWKDTYDP
jgi:hypothetical protein